MTPLTENHSGGAFQVSRSIFTSDIWQKPAEYLKIWLYLIGKANHKQKRYAGFCVERGQYFCHTGELLEQIRYCIGYRKSDTNESTAKRILMYLRETGRITTMKKPRGMLITVLRYDDYQDLKNYERTKEETLEETKGEPDPNPKSPSINKNEKNENNEKNSGEFDRKILKHFSRYEGISNPEAYLATIKVKSSPRAILKAWKDWEKGRGIASPAEFFARCMHYTAESQKTEGVNQNVG